MADKPEADAMTGDEASKFVSATHQRSIELQAAANVASTSGNSENADSYARLANSLARSMGESGRYKENPFKADEHPQLHEQFKQSANLKMQREMDIAGKEADIGHGM